jgi:quercetin dioxygenase-like cupin family protein
MKFLSSISVTIAATMTASFALGWVAAKTAYPPLDVLVSTGQTTIGQSFEYPDGVPKLTAAIVTLEPGAETGWHRHEVPLYAYILQGELAVDYGAAGEKSFGAGDSFIEAFRSAHNGQNKAGEPVRILAVFAGAEETPNTVMGK